MGVCPRRSCLFLACLLLPIAAGAQTRAYLDAPVVTSVIRVEFDKASKKIKFAIDKDAVTHDVPADALLLAKTGTGVIVTYRRLNPLRLQANAAITDVDDPAHANITKLLNAILAVGTIVSPEPPAGGGASAGTTASARRRLSDLADTGCKEVNDALPDALELDAALYGAPTTATSVRAQAKAWIKAIDDGFGHGSGAVAITGAATRMDTFSRTVAAAMAKAQGIVDSIETETKLPAPSERCALLRHYFYDVLSLTDPRERLQELGSLKAAVTALAKTLRDDYGEGHWVDGTDDFKVSGDIAPTGSIAKQVVVKVNSVEFDADDATSGLGVGTTSAASTTFMVRRYSTFATEIGTGAVFGFVHRPKYGTSKNQAGDPIVEATDDEISVDPSLLVNFVCRCKMGPFVAPMIQIGTSTAKSAPAIMIGGGFRLFGFGKGDVAVGGGAVVAFIQELHTLDVGSVVKGTADVDADLRWRPRLRSLDADGNKHTNWYLTIQYKF